MDQKTTVDGSTASMQVLVLGLCRTGTLSMKIALEVLGFKKVYHFSTVDENESHPDLWISALKTKYDHGSGETGGPLNVDWNQLLGEYNAVTDIPAACFAEELIAAYPEAKIILTTRSEESWHKSMSSTIHALQSSYINHFLLLFADERTRKLSHLVNLIIKYYLRASIPNSGVGVFKEHNSMVRDIALKQKREILEFKVGDGWNPLCEFLEKPVIDHQFPHANDSQHWREAFILDWKSRILALLKSLGSWQSCTTVFLAAIFIYIFKYEALD